MAPERRAPSERAMLASLRVRHVSGHDRFDLGTGWETASVAPGSACDPDAVDALALRWIPAPVPGTAASALECAGTWTVQHTMDFDALDWWYRCSILWFPDGTDVPVSLRLGGLATIADVWLNGTHVLRSDNMFVAHELDIGDLLRAESCLHIRFSALATALAERRPRPRWRTRLVERQNLRWVRTTLLGRMPGWTPPAAAVGPWRPASLERRASVDVIAANLRTRVSGRDGVAAVALRVAPSMRGAALTSATLEIGAHRVPLACRIDDQSADCIVEGELRIPDVALWWPHTHGAQPLRNAQVLLRVDGADVSVDLGRVGFRTVELATGSGDGFALRVNETPIFCRGACWSTTDIVRLIGDRDECRAALVAARDAGMNMLRVGGTMVYESDTFYDLCDELGILLWQDFMFANMDYPADDATFVASVTREATQLLQRLQARPSIAILCGNSEVEQQAAMLGLPRELWTNALFAETLPALSVAWCPDVPYWPSSPSGGTLPFHANAGATHYYGVGAYLRPLDDARRAGVRFASECLAFANVPDPRTIDLVPGGASAGHHPGWKAGVPRDAGAGWDFEDVRDHYLERLFGASALSLRYSDMDRYLALSRVTTGEIMAAVFGEWRRPGSTCGGGLVWFYRDLRPGAGWGVVDSTGLPKAAFYYLRRTFKPVVLLISDEGLNGLWLHAVNETASAIDAEVCVSLYRQGHLRVATAAAAVTLPPRGAATVHADALFPGFVDPSYAYRFGPPGHDLVVASMADRTTGAPLGQAFHFPLGLPSRREPDLGLEAAARARSDGDYLLTVRTRRFAQSVAIDAGGFRPDDNYFHVEPGTKRTVTLRAPAAGAVLAGSVAPLNADAPTRIAVVTS